ncbi:MAG: sugar ABC transporter permease [Chloroflexi bacterium]|nr:sugar ABC transporter permease [Chloroflexota bacterium]
MDQGNHIASLGGAVRISPLHSKRSFREAVLAYLFILPSFVIIIVFGLYPVLRAGYMSLHHWSIVKGSFIGLANYRELLGDKAFWQALQVTVFYVVVTVPLTMAFSLLVAYLLFQPIRFRPFFRTLYFLPYVTSLVPAAMVWQWIFNYQSGILNYMAKNLAQNLAALLRVIGGPPWVYLWILGSAVWLAYLLLTWGRRRTDLMTAFLATVAGVLLVSGVLFGARPSILQSVILQLENFFPVRWLQEPRGIILYLGKQWGFTPPPWLHGPSMALLAVCIVSMWHFMGYDTVIYLAGLFNISSDVYEAARIDGASEGQVFWHITFPLLSPTTFFLFMISTIGAFRAFTMFYVLTNGGPLRTTTSVTFYIYDRFYSASRWGYASAIACVLFVIILTMTLINQRIAGRRVFYQ